ncbi:MAG: HAMP domain-containing histidine kinase [Ktedonobacteraceae bacterium]|nr:HAMP domain-containing histidine kinase [Ktedonobacteraceae bacterium]
MRIRWWQSIRWRLALTSVVLSLLATGLLALTFIGALFYYYGVEQKSRMSALATDKAQSIGMDFAQNLNLYKAVQNRMPTLAQNQSMQGQYLFIVLDRRANLVYPRFTKNDPKNALLTYLLKLTDQSFQKDDFSTLTVAIRDALLHGVPTSSEFSRSGPFNLGQPYAVQSIFYNGENDGQVIGVLVVTPRSSDVPAFVSSVGGTVLIAAGIIALLAALVAIYFSRSITRPLTRLTRAARVLGTGDYSVQVATGAPGELGELARTFNEMAAQLNRDVEELKKQESWRRELIMSITHDLATPLTAIAGLGEALVDGVNQSREDYEATGSIIVRETLRLRRLVQDLHVMAKVEAGALHPRKKDVRLAALVDEVLAVLAPEFERVRVEPLNNISYNLPLVQADADMLMRVFSNLCDNALRHTPAGGTVTIDALAREKMLVVSVTDTGEGIPPQALARVFERFYRADSARQSSTGGSGLGLAIVRAIVEAHGGVVWAENISGAGARISFTLPCPAAGEQQDIGNEITLRITRDKRKLHRNRLQASA